MGMPHGATAIPPRKVPTMTKSTLRGLGLALAFVLAIFCLGCGKAKTYNITFAGDHEDLIISMPTEAAEGDEVTIETYEVLDVDLVVYQNGEKIQRSKGGFTFVMPAEDVEITIDLLDYPGGGA